MPWLLPASDVWRPNVTQRVSYTHIILRGTRIPDPPFSSFGPFRDYGMDLCLEVYIFEPFIHILQHFVLQLSHSTNFCF